MTINGLHVPASWSSMSWYQRASYLVNTRQAKDFKAACVIVRGRRKQPQPQEASPRLPYKDE